MWIPVYRPKNSGPNVERVVAALESTVYQTRDLMVAMQKDLGPKAAIKTLRIDGGRAANDWVMQFLADQLDV